MDHPPLWRRIVDFPLIAMVIAIVALIVGITVAYLIASLAIPPIRGVGIEVKFDVVAIPIVLLIYKFIIVRLGRHPRDDLLAAGALRPLAWGLLGGFLLFSLIVAAAAALGVYRITGPGDLTGMPKALVTAAIFPAISE